MNHETHETHERDFRRRGFRVFRAFRGLVFGLMLGAMTTLAAQSNSGEQLAPPALSLSKGHELWRQRLSKSALAAFEAAARDRATAAEAHEAIGRIYMFKGWQQEGVFPGWHDEPEYRGRAIAALEASLAADPTRASAREALKQAQVFAASPGVVPPAPPSAEAAALDAKIESFAGTAAVSNAEFDATIDARTRLQADSGPYFTAAQIMLDRRDYARAADLAQRGAAAAERFIAENESAYRMAGKAAGGRARMRAASLEMLGAVALARMDLAGAATHLEEADRLTRGQDFRIQFRLGELANARRDPDAAANHYLNALSLTGGPAAMRDRAMQAGADLHAALERPDGFEGWLAEEIDRRRAERRAASLRSSLDRPLPALALKGLDGKDVDVAALRGKVLLLNFFSAWCGACRAELPHLQKVYEKYQSDPGVAFLLVSLDTDPKRLQRFLDEQRFPMPIARASQDQAQQAMGFDDVPMTFYVDRQGVVRYETRGVETHGDSAARVTWYIEQIRDF